MNTQQIEDLKNNIVEALDGWAGRSASAQQSLDLMKEGIVKLSEQAQQAISQRDQLLEAVEEFDEATPDGIADLYLGHEEYECLVEVLKSIKKP